MENHFLHYFHRWLATCPGPSWIGGASRVAHAPGGGQSRKFYRGLPQQRLARGRPTKHRTSSAVFTEGEIIQCSTEIA